MLIIYYDHGFQALHDGTIRCKFVAGVTGPFSARLGRISAKVYA